MLEKFSSRSTNLSHSLKGKSLHHPSTMGGGLRNPQPMKRSISPHELFKINQITPKEILKQS
jgi:hypothetical protein